MIKARDAAEKDKIKREDLLRKIAIDQEKAEIMNSNILNSELKIVPRAGHMSPVEEPALVNELIIEFLNKLH